MNDDIRRALDDLVGPPPATIGRRGAVMRRIERVHARRRVAMQATLSAFLVASVAFGATRVISTTPTGTDRLVEQPTATTGTDRKTVPVETPKPKPPKKRAAPPPKQATAKPDPTAEPEPKPKPSSYEKPDQPAPTYTKEPTAKPTYTKDPVANGLSAELWPYTDAVAGESMDWKVKAYDTAGRLLRIELRFGDGKSTVHEPAEACGEGTSVKKFFAHTYAAAGTYTATATVTTGGCGAPTETKTVTSKVKVLAPGSGNGPAAPTVSATQTEGATLALHGADADGWVKKFWVDWGDGSESVVGPRPFDGCQDGKASAWDTTASHDYAEPGTYTVKVTVMSTNCDAGQGQTKTVTVTITV